MKIVSKIRGSLSHVDKMASIYKKLVQESGMECAVGFPTNDQGLATPEAAYDGHASIIQVALWNNYGTDRIPSRPFMDLAAKDMQEVYKKGMKELGPKIVSGQASIEKVLDVLGLQAEECVRRSIMDGEWQANAPATIARKKSDRPLVDTGTMRNRVTHSVRRKS